MDLARHLPANIFTFLLQRVGVKAVSTVIAANTTNQYTTNQNSTKMKTLKLTLSILAMAFMLSSCLKDGGLICRKPSGENVTQTYSVGSFTQITLEMDADVVITQGSDYKVEASAADNIHKILVVKVNGSELVLRTERGKCIRGKSDVVFYVTCPDVKGISLAGSGTMKNSNPLSGDGLDVNIAGSGFVDLNDLTYSRMYVSIAGSGEINVDGATVSDFESKTSGSGNTDFKNLSCQNADLTISGSGSVRLAGSGEADRLKGTISGSGKLHCFDLPANTVEVKISGSGDCEVTCNNQLNATISGSGSVYYKGQPTVNADISGSGKIISSN